MSGSGSFRKRPRSDVGPGRKKPAKHGGGEMTERLSHQILEQARLQRKEVENEEQQRQVKERRTADVTSTRCNRDKVYSGALLNWDKNGDSSNDDESSDGGDKNNDDDQYSSSAADNSESEETLILQEGEYVEALGMAEDEEAKIAQLMRAPAFQRRTFADLIIQKIKEKKEMVTMDEDVHESETAEVSAAASNLPDKVIEVYTKIGAMLKHYTAGKLPKAFKIIPSLSNWEEVLALTNPDEWTPHAVYAATRIFASNFNPQMAQRYYNDVLLERCRGDIAEHRRLNYHLYQSLCKAVYKPAAFFKGILLPLAAAGNCTLQEGTIFASILARVSIPGNHSAVALLKLAAMPYSGATSLFIRVLLNKKYALPHQVIDQLVPNADLPVLWHQSLLVFCQRYKGDITAKDKERLKELLKVHTHHIMSDEARRELFSNSSRREKNRNILPCHR